MDAQWLRDQDVEFHKRQYRAYVAQLVLCNELESRFSGMIRDRMERLLKFGKVTKAQANEIEIEVRAELAETFIGIKDPPTGA